MDHNQERRRGHFHRGRRGPDRRAGDRRTQPPQAQPGRDHVDVEQIMRDIRARIAQRQGVELSNQQIQDLAARRLESILDPRAIKPSLLEGLRRSAGAVAPPLAAKASSEPVYAFDHTTIYDSPRAILRLIRRLLNPFLKLFFNPNPLIRALHLQAQLNVEAAEREAERDRRQAEWNALHYEIIQRVVTDVARVSLEVQALSMRVESLNARVDFSDRRVRTLEGGGAHLTRAAVRPPEAAPSQAPTDTSVPQESAEIPGTEAARRRRRRRRGRRGGVPPGEQPTTGSPPPAASVPISAADETLESTTPDESALPDPGFTPAVAETSGPEFAPDSGLGHAAPPRSSWGEPETSSAAALSEDAPAEPIAPKPDDEPGNGRSDQ
jgi:cell division protein FtsL